MRIDVHQHIWTEPLIDALAARRELPFVRFTGGLTVLHSAGEQPYVIDVNGEEPGLRASLVHADGLDRALIAISSPIGIEALRRDVAGELIGQMQAAWLTFAADGRREHPDHAGRVL